MANTSPVSCYIRTLNEERRIGDVLTAVKKLTNDIVIVDSGSTDQTQTIAKNHGATVIEQAWLGNGKQKRVGEEACRHDWVLDLDADEIISDKLINEISSLIESSPANTDLFALKLVTVPPVGKAWHTFNLPERIKLYNRSFIRMPDHTAWDQLDLPKGTKPKTLKHPIYHYSFKDIAHLLRKQNRVSSVRAHETRLKSKPYIIFRIFFGFPFYFIRIYFLRGQFRGGVYGFAASVVTAFGRWLKDVKMYERHKGLGPDGH